MNWIFFSILASFGWAIVAIIDKYVLSKWVRKPVISSVIGGFIGVFGGGLIFAIRGFPILGFPYIFLAVTVGLIYFLSVFFYFQAVRREEISRVMPMFQIGPIFVAALAYFTFGEIFNLSKYFGILLLVIGAVFLSSKGFLKIRSKKVFLFVLASTFVWAVGVVIERYLLFFADYWTVFSYIYMGKICLALPLFCLNFKEFSLTVKSYGKRAVGVVSLSETLTLLASLAYIIAISVGYLTLVSALTSVGPFFVMLFAVILSIFYPKILKEEITKKTILAKLLAMVLMFIGVMLIV